MVWGKYTPCNKRLIIQGTWNLYLCVIPFISTLPIPIIDAIVSQVLIILMKHGCGNNSDVIRLLYFVRVDISWSMYTLIRLNEDAEFNWYSQVQ